MVLADRYIYTLMVRDMVRGMDEAWLKNLYGIALVPDAVFYLNVSAGRTGGAEFRQEPGAGLLGERHGFGIVARNVRQLSAIPGARARPSSRSCRPSTVSPSSTATVRRRKSTSNCGGRIESMLDGEMMSTQQSRNINHRTWPKPAAKANIYVGVDLGGTKILAGVFDEKLKCLGRTKMSTKSERGAGGGHRTHRPLRAATRWMNAIWTSSRSRGVGIGAPGAVDAGDGQGDFRAATCSWQDMPLKKDLEKQLGGPGLGGERLQRRARSAFMKRNCRPSRATWSAFSSAPASAAGIIVDGKLYSGFNGTAGEVGPHGASRWAARNAIAAIAAASRRWPAAARFSAQIQAAVKDGQKTVLTEMLGAGFEGFAQRRSAQGHQQGDKLVEKIVEEAAEYTGIAVANLINIFNPASGRAGRRGH